LGNLKVQDMPFHYSRVSYIKNWKKDAICEAKTNYHKLITQITRF